MFVKLVKFKFPSFCSLSQTIRIFTHETLSLNRNLHRSLTFFIRTNSLEFSTSLQSTGVLPLAFNQVFKRFISRWIILWNHPEWLFVQLGKKNESKTIKIRRKRTILTELWRNAFGFFADTHYFFFSKWRLRDQTKHPLFMHLFLEFVAFHRRMVEVAMLVPFVRLAVHSVKLRQLVKRSTFWSRLVDNVISNRQKELSLFDLEAIFGLFLFTKNNSNRRNR